MIDKFPEELRTFETRAQFINQLFSNLFSMEDIMAHCIIHKLDRSFLLYEEKLAHTMIAISGEDPLNTLLKNIK